MQTLIHFNQMNNNNDKMKAQYRVFLGKSLQNLLKGRSREANLLIWVLVIV